MTACNPEAHRTVALEILHGADTSLTTRAYIRKISDSLSVSTRRAKAILRSLVDDQTLAYQDLYGSTCVMQSFSKPVRITDRFCIVPPGTDRPPAEGNIDIAIHPGISFGSGSHPTTRLCLKALDHLLRDRFRNCAGGDIGTGSGVLAIAMCLAGMAGCRAWEIDPNAVSEARKNVALNGLESRIQVIDDRMSPDGPPLSLICANLRYPTLSRLAPLLLRTVLPGACLVFSGLRTWEKQDLVSQYRACGFRLTWERDEKNWSALVLEFSP